MKMPFGKFKNIEVCDIEDLSYIKWLESQDWIDKFLGLREELQHEIERREGDRPNKGLVRPKLDIK